MPRDDQTPITDALLDQGQLLAIATPQTDAGFEAWGLQITRTAEIRKTYTEMQDIDPGASVSPDALGEDGHAAQTTSPGDNVFRLLKDEDETRVYHFGQLWQPNDLQIYWENPNDELSQGWTRQTRVTVDDDEGWTAWSDETQYTDKIPTTALETVIIPGETPFIGFSNEGETVAQPTGQFYGVAYKVDILNRTSPRLAARVITGLGVQRDIKVLGGLDPFSVSTPDSWGRPIEITEGGLSDILNAKVGDGNPQAVIDAVAQTRGG